MTPTLLRLPASCLALLLLLALLPSARAPAATFEVDGTADTVDANPGDSVCADATGACTLRAAVVETNALPGADAVNLPAGHYVLSASPADLRVTEALTLSGAGAEATIIDAAGGGEFALIYAEPTDPPFLLTVTDLTITGSDPTSAVVWGAVFVGGDLILNRVAVRDNSGPVAAITVVGSATIERSVVSGNSSSNHAIFVIGPTTIVGSTISGNSSSAAAIAAGGNSLILNSTIANNTAASCGVSRCGDLCVASSGAALNVHWTELVRVVHSTVSNNECLSGPWRGAFGNFPIVEGSVLSNSPNCIWPIASAGHNLDSDGTCGLNDPTDLSNVDPLLGPLQNNSGPTPTHALLAGSPAIDAIPAEDCTYDDDGDPGTPEVPLTTDQRGVRRPQGAGCDIGAFERRGACGLGAELALLLPLLKALRRRRA